MELYKKPVMEIVELEKVDVLTCSQQWVGKCGCTENHVHSEAIDCNVCHPEQG